ncbi:Uncharacterized protein PBTT_00985 [Plasmodiophora brassicae]
MQLDESAMAEANRGASPAFPPLRPGNPVPIACGDEEAQAPFEAPALRVCSPAVRPSRTPPSSSAQRSPLLVRVATVVHVPREYCMARPVLILFLFASVALAAVICVFAVTNGFGLLGRPSEAALTRAPVPAAAASTRRPALAQDQAAQLSPPLGIVAPAARPTSRAPAASSGAAPTITQQAPTRRRAGSTSRPQR